MRLSHFEEKRKVSPHFPSLSMIQSFSHERDLIMDKLDINPLFVHEEGQGTTVDDIIIRLEEDA